MLGGCSEAHGRTCPLTPCLPAVLLFAEEGGQAPPTPYSSGTVAPARIPICPEDPRELGALQGSRQGLCGQQLGPDPNYLYLGDGAAVQWGRWRGGMCPSPIRTQPVSASLCLGQNSHPYLL